MKYIVTAFMLCIGIMASADSSYGQKSVKLKKVELTKVKVGNSTFQCGLVGSKWKAVKKSGNKYTVTTSSPAATKACKKLLGRGAISGLEDVPSVQGLAKANSRSSSDIGYSTLAVVGTPPTLASIARGDVDISRLFWRDGVVEAVRTSTATEFQCLEFYGGLGTDGTSGQFSACYISQNVGFSFQTILEGGTSLCYMKRAPKQTHLDAGAIALVSGTFPTGGVEELLSPPAGSSARLVEVRSIGFGEENQRIMIKIDPQDSLRTSGDHYKAALSFCSTGGSPIGLQNLRIRLTGEFISSEVRSDSEGQSRNTLSAFLRSISGALEFDTTRTRTATAEFSGSEGLFKSDVRISGNNIITAKTYDSFGSEQRKAVAVAHFNGNSMSDFRYDQGAYKHQTTRGDESTVNEYREPNYVNSEDAETADGTDLIDLRDEISFTSSFFSDLTFTTVDFTGHNCGDTPDIVVSMDMTHPLMQVVQQACEGERLQGMDFCRTNPDVTAAENNFPTACPGVF